MVGTFVRKKRLDTGSVVDVQLSQPLDLDLYEPVCSRAFSTQRRGERTVSGELSDLDLLDEVGGVGFDGAVVVLVDVLLHHAGVWFALLSFMNEVSCGSVRTPCLSNLC